MEKKNLFLLCVAVLMITIFSFGTKHPETKRTSPCYDCFAKYQQVIINCNNREKENLARDSACLFNCSHQPQGNEKECIRICDSMYQVNLKSIQAARSRARTTYIHCISLKRTNL